MTIEKASKSLLKTLEHFPWLIGVGVWKSEGKETIFLYVTSKNHKELKALQGEWKGFPISITTTGEVRHGLVQYLNEKKRSI